MPDDPHQSVRIWHVHELTFHAAGTYANPYADVQLWVKLTGPGFSQRVYGFWDGGDTFKVRVVATSPGAWSWTLGSNQPDDAGLRDRSGGFDAVAWSPEELAVNANRRGFVRATDKGRALQYADGSPFFLLADTWWPASTWRLPMEGAGITFPQAIALRKSQEYNSITMIAAYPNWSADDNPHTYANADGVFLRNAWEKFGHLSKDGELVTAKDMHDERGNLAFAVLENRDGLADFDRLNPAYFQSLDRKMHHLADAGFVPLLEPVRRDCTPAWDAYFDFETSYTRYLQYLIARYGAFNVIFSGIHLDWIPEGKSLQPEQFHAVLNHHHATFGPPPFGQPMTVLIDSSTSRRFGHGDACPWLTLHSVGNFPRHHGMYALLEEQFDLDPPRPNANLEPYYTGWDQGINKVAGEIPPAGSDRDVYYCRAMMYGSVLSGGLAGHVHGTGAYDITTDSEPVGWRPRFSEAIQYPSGEQLQHLGAFVLSEGERYRDLLLASDDLDVRKAPGSLDDGLEGWSFMMRTPDASLALLYFEQSSACTSANGFASSAVYRWQWFDPRTGRWSEDLSVTSDSDGRIAIPARPDGQDWAARLCVEA